MFGTVKSVAILLIMAMLGACASKPPIPISRPAAAWEAEFDHPVSYHTMIGDDLMVVGTTRHLFGVNPRTGDKLWRLRNVNTNRRDVVHVEGAPYILVNDATGGAFDDAGSYLLAVDRYEGVLHWESPVVEGRILQARIDLDQRRIFAVTVQGAHGDDRGLLHDLLPGKGLMSGFKGEPELIAISSNDGSLLWRQDLGVKVPMRPSARLGVGDHTDGERPFDLELYHPPTLVNGKVCVTYTGIACFDARSGRPIWAKEFDVVDDELGLAYPNPVVNSSMVIAGDIEQLFALDPDSGEEQWETEDLGRVPELLDDENILYAQIGGRYFDLDKEEWVAEGDFGVAAINKRSGNILWDYDRVRRSISNLLVADAFVWFADEETLFALDRLDGTVVIRKSHRMGEPPTYVLLNEREQIVLISETEAAGYDFADGDILWYQNYPPPGPGAWKRFAAGLLTVSGNLFKLTSTLIAYGGGLLPSVPNITAGGRKVMSGRSLAEDTTGYLGEKFSETGEVMGAISGFANLSGHTQYFITRPRGEDQVLLAAVDLNSGSTRELTALPSQTADLVIDEINGHAYQADGNVVIAVPLGR